MKTHKVAICNITYRCERTINNMREWLKQVRKERNLTQGEVASKAFINRAFYSQIENGLRNPSFVVARNIVSVKKFSNDCCTL
ncbi:helix-turn-helix transcriptional regulator [Sutcliffiella cohnii]